MAVCHIHPVQEGWDDIHSSLLQLHSFNQVSILGWDENIQEEDLLQTLLSEQQTYEENHQRFTEQGKVRTEQYKVRTDKVRGDRKRKKVLRRGVKDCCSPEPGSIAPEPRTLSKLRLSMSESNVLRDLTKGNLMATI